MKRNFKNKTVVITGASSGLGAWMSKRVVDEGGKVVMLARRLDPMLEIVSENNWGDRALPLSCDVTCEDSVKRCLEEAAKFGNGIDGLINNAGSVYIGSVRSTKTSKIEQVMNVNYFGSVYCTQAVIPHLNEGSFVAFTSSIASSMTTPESNVYTTSKAAVRNYADALRFELLPRGVDVLCFCPGFFETDFLKGNDMLPWTMSLDYVGNRYIKDIKSGVQEDVFPWQINFIYSSLQAFKLITPRQWWFSLTAWMSKGLWNVKGKGEMNIDPSKEISLRDPFGFKTLVYGLLRFKGISNFVTRILAKTKGAGK